MRPVAFRRFARDLHSVAKQAPFSAAFRSDLDLGAVWEIKMEATIDFWKVFWRCFFRMRSGIDFGAFFRGSNLEKSLKTIGFSMVLAIFQKIGVFEKVSKKHGFWDGFRRPKP